MPWKRKTLQLHQLLALFRIHLRAALFVPLRSFWLQHRTGFSSLRWITEACPVPSTPLPLPVQSLFWNRAGVTCGASACRMVSASAGLVTEWLPFLERSIFHCFRTNDKIQRSPTKVNSAGRSVSKSAFCKRKLPATQCCTVGGDPEIQ